MNWNKNGYFERLISQSLNDILCDNRVDYTNGTFHDDTMPNENFQAKSWIDFNYQMTTPPPTYTPPQFDYVYPLQSDNDVDITVTEKMCDGAEIPEPSSDNRKFIFTFYYTGCF